MRSSPRTGSAEPGSPGREPQRAFLHVAPGELVNPESSSWSAFRQSWENLPRDTWMADDGMYRRRRYAAFRVNATSCLRLPHQPHYQQRTHNPLNGGVQRWFEPLTEGVAKSPLFKNLITDTGALIGRSDSQLEGPWLVEAHQFRIEARPGEVGLPTPEGMHHDGRTWVLVLFIGGRDFEGGLTRIESNEGVCVLEHRLLLPGEGLLLDDRRVRHGTSPIEASAAATIGNRDTLVLTYARQPPEQS
jgi:hypothetical protein